MNQELSAESLPEYTSATEVAREFHKAALRVKSGFANAEGRISYEDLAQSEAYAALLRQARVLRQLDLGQLVSKEEKISFWVNVYNALVVHGIVHHRPQKSVREVSGFFDQVSYSIGGFHFSLNEIENGVLRANRRPPYRWTRPFSDSDPRLKFVLAEDQFDPRIHFVLNCGSQSCPPFSFYSSDRLEQQLELATKGFVNAESRAENGAVLVSKIFDWYSGDFGPTVRVFLKRYARGDLLSALEREEKIKYLDYDWSLNKSH